MPLHIPGQLADHPVEDGVVTANTVPSEMFARSCMVMVYMEYRNHGFLRATHDALPTDFEERPPAPLPAMAFGAFSVCFGGYCRIRPYSSRVKVASHNNDCFYHLEPILILYGFMHARMRGYR